MNATVLIRRTLVVLASLFLTTPAWSLSFTVVNNSDEGIILVYATPSYHNTFGNNLLEELNTIRPGDELAFSVDLYGDHCTFDIFIGASLINREVYNSVNICKTTHVYFPSAERYKTARQSFTVVNAHDAEVMSIHVSRTDETVWGEDRLGADMLQAGGKFMVEMNGYGNHCMFDIRITSYNFLMVLMEQDPYIETYPSVNLCDTDQIVFPQGADEEPKGSIAGTAFAITADGKLLTNHHVVDECVDIAVRGLGMAILLAYDEGNDLAILAVAEGENTSLENVAVFRSEPKVRLGETVVVYGFPESDIMSREGVVSSGILSSLTGYKSNPAEYQTTVPTLPGNSGGPLLDGSGHVIGVVSSRLDPEISQNVTYAIKWNVVQRFLEESGVEPVMAPSDQTLQIPDIVGKATGYVLPVTCK